MERRETLARWNAALMRALDNKLTIRAANFGVTGFTVSSASSELSHHCDAHGVRCSCTASEHNDPVCQHRALVREHIGTFPTIDVQDEHGESCTVARMVA